MRVFLAPFGEREDLESTLRQVREWRERSPPAKSALKRTRASASALRIASVTSTPSQITRCPSSPGTKRTCSSWPASPRDSTMATPVSERAAPAMAARVGRSLKNSAPMPSMDRVMVKRRPLRSANQPKKMPPKGRMKKPTANTANVPSKAASGSSL